MELYKEILLKALGEKEITIMLSGLTIKAAEIIEAESYKALQKIKAIIEDDNLDDEQCFMKIEAIICLLEDIGSDGGNRHDFG